MPKNKKIESNKVFIVASINDYDFQKKLKEFLESLHYSVKTNEVTHLTNGAMIMRASLHENMDSSVFILVMSHNSFKSKETIKQFSALAIEKKNQLLVVNIDDSATPSYLMDHPRVSLSIGYINAFDSISRAIYSIRSNRLKPTEPMVSNGDEQSKLNSKYTDEDNVAQYIEPLTKAYRAKKLALICGAGTSVSAGIPKWGDLLNSMFISMLDKMDNVTDIEITKPEYISKNISQSVSSLILGKYLKNNLNENFDSILRDCLYQNKPTTCNIINSIVKLSRPQRDGRILDSIITFNFDGLIEENLEKSNVPHKTIFSESIGCTPNELPIYHVHGYLPRNGNIPDCKIVFSEDGYHSQFLEPFSWSNIIQIQKLTQNVCLFIGISLTDPNMRRLLDIAWRKNPEEKSTHFLIKKLPESAENPEGKLIKLLEEQDANLLGINLIWIKDFNEIPTIMDSLLD
ncbi:MAG: SIR2 family protein [Hafnia sp.]